MVWAPCQREIEGKKRWLHDSELAALWDGPSAPFGPLDLTDDGRHGSRGTVGVRGWEC